MRVVEMAQASDPSIEDGAGERLARAWLRLLREHLGAAAAELARRCVAHHPDANVS